MTRGLDLDQVPVELRAAVVATLAAVGLDDGHISLSLVSPERIAELNQVHRGKPQPTDVLSFPIDGIGPVNGPRELGDIVICPEQSADLIEAAVHGTLHLCGYDHETDRGEMLALQDEIIGALELAGSSR